MENDFNFAEMAASLSEEDFTDEKLTSGNADADALADADADDEGYSIDGLSPDQIRELQERIRAKLFEPKPYELKQSKKIIAIVDTETDPFSPGLVVAPFTLGFYDGNRYVDFWGDDCVDQFFEFLAAETDEYIIYAHNGGKFDFFFFLKYLDADQTPLIMNGRLVKAYFQGQEFRDSFSIIPQALGTYQKDKIDYNLFTKDKREQHRLHILKYQKSDCVYLFDLVAGFHEMFGDKITIASASLPMLHSYTGFARIKREFEDERFRQYYYGGRNQCFEQGILKPKNSDTWMVIDRNSMYPAVMRDVLHPVSATYDLQRELDENTDFACIEAFNDNCLPIRAADGGLDFTCKKGMFYATIHEIKAGLETGTLKIIKVKHAWAFHRKASFADFVERFYNLRLEAKSKGDKVKDILYKFCLNSGYGKFALNPRKFKQWTFTIEDAPEPLASMDDPEGWTLHSESGRLYIWSRPSPRRSGFYNVATAASITGAARANLHLALALSKRPIYCDTDSIICELYNGPLNDTELGGWKLEATGDTCAIGGKKLYALFNGDDPVTDSFGKPKKASKGSILTSKEIMRVAQGEVITWANPVPNFKLDGSSEFVTREIKKTGGSKTNVKIDDRQPRFL